MEFGFEVRGGLRIEASGIRGKAMISPLWTFPEAEKPIGHRGKSLIWLRFEVYRVWIRREA